MHHALPLCLTLGDPTGIGPDIVARWLGGDYMENPVPLRVFGNIDHLEATAAHYNGLLPQPEDFPVVYHHIQAELPGRIAYDSVVRAIKRIHQGEGCALVTGPINKQQLWQAGVAYPGHTEMLAALANKLYAAEREGVYESDMLFQYHQFRVLLLTRHIPLHSVSEHLTVPGVVASLKRLVAYLQQVEGIATPRLCLLGVNPHAGEIGGTEEANILMPARAQVMRDTNAYITEPMAADGVFRGFNAASPEYHAYIAPTHDQGLIPMKMAGGLDAVNVTIGLPFIRTSVSHGTAMDLVGTGKASIRGMTSAVALAQHLVQRQQLAAPALQLVGVL